MFCEMLQEEITDEVCTQCWKDLMIELTREWEANRLLVGAPQTITREDCKKENIL